VRLLSVVEPQRTPTSPERLHGLAACRPSGWMGTWQTRTVNRNLVSRSRHAVRLALQPWSGGEKRWMLTSGLGLLPWPCWEAAILAISSRSTGR